MTFHVHVKSKDRKIIIAVKGESPGKEQKAGLK